MVGYISPFAGLDALAESLKKMPIRQLVTQNEAINPQDREKFIMLLGHPSKSVQKRAIKLVNLAFNGEYSDISLQNYSQKLSPADLQLTLEYFLHFIASKIPEYATAAFKQIQREPAVFEPLLIDALICANDAIVVNTVQVLAKLFPNRFPEPIFEEIVVRLNETEKLHLLSRLKIRLDDPELIWFIREDAIRMVGALKIDKGVVLLQSFIHDPDQFCLLALVKALAGIHSSAADQVLFSLVGNSLVEVRIQAAQALGNLVPERYGGKSPHSILTSVGLNSPQDVLALFRTPEGILDTPFFHRVWHRLEYAPEVFLQFDGEEDSVLLEAFRKEIHQGVLNPEYRAFILILTERMPRILHIVDNSIQKSINEEERAEWMGALSAIQNEFKVQQSSDHFILL